MILAGIDPGVTGALAILDDPGDGRPPALLAVHDLPTITDPGGPGRQRVSAAGLAALLRAGSIACVIVEQVGAAPVQGRRQGAQSMFNFGRGVGIIEGVTQTLGLPLHYVTPQAWKARAGLLRSPKDPARAKALQLYPDAPLHRKADGGRADAILIARYGQPAQAWSQSPSCSS